MSWKLGLVLAGMLALVSGGVYLAGQFYFQEELTVLPEQDEAPPPFASEHEEPALTENLPVQPMEKDQIITVPAQDDVTEKKPEVPIVSSIDPALVASDPPPAPAQTKDPPPQYVDPPKPTSEPPQVKIEPIPTPPLPQLPGPPPVSNDEHWPPPAPPRDVVVQCPWSIQMEVVKGRTIVTAKAGKDSSFRIECDQLDLQAPKGSLRASGKVKISGPGLEGTSNVLTLNLHEDRVLLEGAVNVKSRRDKQDLELTGDRLSLRLLNTSAQVEKINLDFGFPIVNGPADRAQLFSFWVGLFR